MTKKRYDVITLGSGTIDVFANTEAQYSVTSGKEMISYPTGSKILINELKFEIGGGGTNTALAMSRLGLKAAWLGKVGSDDNSKQILDFMKRSKIDFIGTKGKGMTGYSVVLDSVGHDRTILTHKGENNNLKFTEISLTKLNTRWFYFCSMMGPALATQKKLAVFAKNKGIKIAFNPSSYQAKMGAHKLKTILKNTSVLVFNLDEAKLLLDIESSHNTSMMDIMKSLHSLGPEIIVVTDGNKGAYCSDKKNLYTLYPHNIKIVETTGAGDAFTSSFVSGLIMKDNIEYALKLGLVNAESVIRHYGAKNILLSLKEAHKHMKKPTRLTKVKFQ